MGTKKCAFVFKELHHVASPEIPDCLGFKPGQGPDHGSILVECKISRADFLADAKKAFRSRSESGVGAYRFFLCPEGVIRPEDLPERWGLVWVNAKGKALQVCGPKGNCWSYSGKNYHFADRNLAGEWGMMTSALRRLHLRGVLPQIYDNPFKKEAQ